MCCAVKTQVHLEATEDDLRNTQHQSAAVTVFACFSHAPSKVTQTELPGLSSKSHTSSVSIPESSALQLQGAKFLKQVGVYRIVDICCCSVQKQVHLFLLSFLLSGQLQLTDDNILSQVQLHTPQCLGCDVSWLENSGVC